MNSRNITLDYLKAFGIFLVIFGHLKIENKYIINWIYSFHVPLFFIISGFLHHQSPNFKDFIIKNFKALIVPYFFFYIICWFLEIPVKQIKVFLDFSIHDLLLKPFFGMILMEGSHSSYSMMMDIPLWFIISLFWVKILFFLINKVFGTKNYFLISMLISLIFAYLLKQNNIFIFSIDSSLVVLIFYAFGYLFKSLIEKQNFNFTKITNFLLFIVLIFISFYLTSVNGFVDTNRMNFGNYVFIYFVNALICFFSFYFLFKNFTSIPNLISNISKSTLTILAIHCFFNYLINKIFFQIPKTNFYPLPIAVIISIFSLLLSYLFHVFIEKYFPFILGRFNSYKK